jgi:hypothetical protein
MVSCIRVRWAGSSLFLFFLMFTLQALWVRPLLAQSDSDDWNYDKGTVVISHSAFDNDAGQSYNPYDLFGTQLTGLLLERGGVVFDDIPSNSFVDFVEWSMPQRKRINRVGVFGYSDTEYNRFISRVRLLFWNESLSQWDVGIDRLNTSPEIVFAQSFDIPATVTPARRFRMEFYRLFWSNPIADGPRVTEIDGYSSNFINGDADLDSDVDFADLLVMAQNYGAQSGRSWHQGDFDFNGSVNFSDLLSLAQNYGQGTSVVSGLEPTEEFERDWSRAVSMIPEPSVLLAGFGLIAFAASRRRSL